jgi:hypothetical protein
LDISWRDDALALDTDRKGTHRIGHRSVCTHDGDGLGWGVGDDAIFDGRYGSVSLLGIGQRTGVWFASAWRPCNRAASVRES